MIRSDALAGWDDCLESLYASVGNEGEFAAALGAFRSFFGAQSVIFLSQDISVSGSTHVIECDVPQPSPLEYHSHFFKHDPWVLETIARNGMRYGSAFRGSELVPRRDLVKSYFWRDFLLRYGITDVLPGVVEGTDDGARFTFVTFQRFAGQPPFPASAVPRLRSLLPHLRRCLRLHRRLAPQLSLGRTMNEVFRASDSVGADRKLSHF